MKLSDENGYAFLLQIHQDIDETINFVSELFRSEKENSLEYYVLTDAEEEFVKEIKKSPLFQSIIKKVLTRSLDDSYLRTLGIIDGTSEPLGKFNKRSDFLLIDQPENFEESRFFLRELFFETYEIWEKMK